MGMKLIVGLGNPGPKYQLTRHNVGFLFIDALVETYGGGRSFKSEFKGESQRVTIKGETVIALKPQTFMNLSGESVGPLLNFYNLTPKDLLVVHDEVDVGFGQMRFQFERGHGGHNGIRSIHQILGTNAYARLRLGVGRPPGTSSEVHGWVLGNFSSTEQAELPEVLGRGLSGVELWIERDIQAAATLFNGPGPKEKK